MRSLLVKAIAGLAMTGAGFAVGGPSASAAEHPRTAALASIVCTTESYCLNDWNGNTSIGAQVLLYQQGSGNEGFSFKSLPRCTDSSGQPTDLVTSTCPFEDHARDAYYEGYPIIQIPLDGTSRCVGTDTTGGLTGFAVLQSCNNTSTGFGGGPGTVFVLHNSYLISLWATDKDGGSTGTYPEGWCLDPESNNEYNSAAIDLQWPTYNTCTMWGATVSD